MTGTNCDDCTNVIVTNLPQVAENRGPLLLILHLEI